MNAIRTITCATSLLILLAGAMPAMARDSRHTPHRQHPHLTPASVTMGDHGVRLAQAKSRPAQMSSHVAAKEPQKPSDDDSYVPYDGPYEQR